MRKPRPDMSKKSATAYIISMFKSQVVWFNLGQAIAACFVALGFLCAFIKPENINELFAVTRKSVNEDAKLEEFTVVAVHKDKQEVVATLVGGRCLAIGVAILALSMAGRNEEVGLVLLSSLCACIPDVWLMWLNKKYPE